MHKYNPDWASQIFNSFRLESFVFERARVTFVAKINLLIKISGISRKYGTNKKKLVELKLSAVYRSFSWCYRDFYYRRNRHLVVLIKLRLLFYKKNVWKVLIIFFNPISALSSYFWNTRFRLKINSKYIVKRNKTIFL